MSTLLVGFDSAWTAANKGAVVGAIRLDEGGLQPLGLPVVANFDAAVRTIEAWQIKHSVDHTIVLIDQPTIVKNPTGQRPVENIVASLVGRRLGGIQPANTGRSGMFDDGAPIWPFLNRFGGAANFRTRSRPTEVFETYPVLTIIARGWILTDKSRSSGRLPKYNPIRRSTFRIDDWAYLCEKLSRVFRDRGIAVLADWIGSIQHFSTPRKYEQDRLDACLCLLVAMDLAEGRRCLVVGEQETGYIVTTASELVVAELNERCLATERDPSRWIHELVLATGPR